MKKNLLRNQKGFTLIEIIAVLVILGILAAVAIPKYMSLQADARNSAAQSAVAEGAAQVNNAAARYILANGTVPTTLAHLTGLATNPLVTPLTSGDWTLTFTQGTTNTPSINVAAAGNAATSVTGGAANKDIPLPR